MKTYKGTFQLPPSGGVGSFTYFDTVESPFKWMAKIELKMRNTARIIKIERILKQNTFSLLQTKANK